MIQFKTRNRGFTLIELVATVAIVGLLSVTGNVAYRQFRNTSDLKRTGQEIVSMVRDAQSRALTSQTNSTWAVKLTSTACLLLQNGTVISTLPISAGRIDIPAVFADDAGATTDTITFNVPGGATLNEGTVTIRALKGPHRITIAVNTLGTTSLIYH